MDKQIPLDCSVEAELGDHHAVTEIAPDIAYKRLVTSRFGDSRRSRQSSSSPATGTRCTVPSCATHSSSSLAISTG